ncbi:MAG TPA: CpsB/CapC family capsule biosynthesis tyrosine phosphatase [Gemmatimonadales bacterium]|nr:CpsB/CapC family capsule biosynthesis tyrosine phosphatase [Gemmatimonadales bacterium]
MIDLHNHLLPGVDDGSRSVAQSVRVLDRFASEGVTDVCLTPHLMASEAGRGAPEAHHRAFEELRVAAPRTPALHRGAEILLDRPLPDAVATDRRVTLAGTRFVLVEFTRQVTFQAAAAALAHVVEIGLTPVLAHPERYACCTPEVVKRWKALGAIMQVDATTLGASRGRGERARALVAEGLADILAGDNHGDDRSLATARTYLGRHGGVVQAQLLLEGNPAAILAGGTLAPVPPLPFRTPLLARLRNLLSEHDQ